MVNPINQSSDTLQLSTKSEKLFDNLGAEKTLEKNTTLYRQGEQADCFYYLKSGSIKTFFNSIDGMQKTISIVGNGSILGEAAFFDQMPRIASAQTITRCTVIKITSDKLKKAFSESPELAFLLLKIQAQSIRMLSSQVSGMVFSKADCRIANQLLQSYTPYNGQLIVNLTHEEIGNLVGTSRVTVSKILNKFAEDKIIKTAYRYIVLTDIEKLEKLASIQ